MQFLDGAATQVELARLISKSTSIRMAVAFWGQPAPKTLGLLTTGIAPEIICNLKMGGTNPAAIEALQNKGVNVLQSDHLHGKVYLFDNEAIVGSSNASANGLSLQDREIRGWHEANILLSEPAILQKIAEWFKKLPRRKIETADLDAAKEAWSRRRRVGLEKPPSSRTTLIEDLRKDPGLFKGRRVFVCVYSQGLSPAGEKSLKHAKRQAALEFADNIDGFEWDDLPDFADLVCFWRSPNNRFSHDGLVHMPEVREEVTKYGTRFQVCRAIKAVAGYPQSRVGTASTWASALRPFLEDSEDSSGRFMDLGEFAERYLSEVGWSANVAE